LVVFIDQAAVQWTSAGTVYRCSCNARQAHAVWQFGL